MYGPPSGTRNPFGRTSLCGEHMQQIKEACALFTDKMHVDPNNAVDNISTSQ